MYLSSQASRLFYERIVGKILAICAAALSFSGLPSAGFALLPSMSCSSHS